MNSSPSDSARPGFLRIFLATGNRHKAQEFQKLADASGLAVTIEPAAQMPSVVEDAGTFVGNARKKAAALKVVLPPDAWVLADDSGLCVDALDGAPGVESAYYAGPKANGVQNLAKLVERMRPVDDTARQAHFICVLVLRGPDGAEHVFEGRCDGRLQREPAGAGGFGYDPVFVPVGYAQTFAELGDEVKNRLSHRGRAWVKLAEWLDTK